MGVIENLPLKNIVPIFIVTFVMIFVAFTFIEPSMYCEDSGGAVPDCRIMDSSSFIMGVLASGVLFLLDMALLYMTLGDFFLPDLASDQE